MKRILSTALLAFLCVAASAQFQKGMKVFNFNLSGSYVQDKDDIPDNNAVSTYTQQNFNTNINGGYFVSDRWSLGLRLGYHFYNRNAVSSAIGFPESENTYREHRFSIGIVAQRFFVVSQNLSFFLANSLLYEHGNGSNQYTPGDETSITKTNTGRIAISPGVNYFIHPKVALQVYLGNLNYSFTRENRYVDDRKIRTGNAHQLGYALNFSSIQFGVSFFLR
jgi:hemolysin activation/secretion protein